MDGPKGLGDFHSRSNRDRDRRWRNHDRQPLPEWDATPRSVRELGDAPSVRVPNVGWESTPRGHRGANGSGWGRATNRSWDTPTPRAARGGSPDADDGAFAMDVREWEDEQIKLDRDWYTGAEEGGVAGDDEHNPLAQYEDLNILKQAEIATKQTVSVFSVSFRLMLTPLKRKISARQAQYVSSHDSTCRLHLKFV